MPDLHPDSIYSFLDAIMMRALPVQRPEELVILKWHTKDFPVVSHRFSGSSYKDPRAGFTSGNFPFPEFEVFRAGNDELSNVFAFSGIGRIIVQVQGRAEIASGELVSGNFYNCFGVRQALGRLIAEEDDRVGANVAVISYAWWQRRFVADTVLGQELCAELPNAAPEAEKNSTPDLEVADMCGWMRQCAELLDPLYGRLKQRGIRVRVDDPDAVVKFFHLVRPLRYRPLVSCNPAAPYLVLRVPPACQRPASLA